MKSLLLAALFAAFCVSSVYAADDSGPPQGGAAAFGQRKAMIINHIDERIAQLQAMKACVKSAQSREDMKGCREKYGPKKNAGGGGQGTSSDGNDE
jgi:opacity protein-like surface antigen